jgi:hypothetical protein
VIIKLLIEGQERDVLLEKLEGNLTGTSKAVFKNSLQIQNFEGNFYEVGEGKQDLVRGTFGCRRPFEDSTDRGLEEQPP